MLTTIPPDPTTSVLVAGRYRLLEPLARGGVAWVWRAHDETLDRAVAVKIVRADADPALTERLRAEAQAAAKVRHTGVITVYDTGTHDGVPFIVMELVEGETLRALLQREGRLAPAMATGLLHQIAAAVDALHRAGVMHGDLKPENIMVTPDGLVKITDLGLARALWQRGAESEEHLYGTPGYLAPERRRGTAGDARSDIYALGAILFETVTGVRPGESDLPWAPAVEPSVPDELAAVIARATDPDPAVRYPSAGAMALQLASGPTGGGTETQMFDAGERETVALRPPAIGPIPRSRTRDIGSLLTPRRRRAAILATLIAMLASLLWFGPINRTEVPKVTGLSQEAAESALSTTGLDAAIEAVYDRDAPVGEVVSQDPAPGTRIRRGSAVQLQVSLGPRIEEVPPTEGMTPEAARARLEEAGFTQIAEATGYSDAVQTGEVIGTRPAAGQRAETEEPITLVVSRGAKTISIPPITGMSQAEAIARLKDIGFKTSVARESSRDVPEGEALRSEPGAGQRAERGSVVTVVVSDGKPRVTVPDLGCMSKKQADDALKDSNLEGDFQGSGKRVVDQDPSPGQKVREGSTVVVYLGFGAFCRGGNREE